MPMYVFTEVGNKAVCLLCNECVAVFKEPNISRHFATKHAVPCRQRNGKQEQQNWTVNLQNSRMYSEKPVTQTAATHASFVVA